ncbi:MAG: sulfurtransferase-like selenium metabolism protein YedF [Spirochaetaceae bacterium]|jgi:selenium metabolism protein YedF|nr:sulfurtransferase-like selenium metabolism protein YedF [Spirochaetaceae bacterium]
MKKSIDGRTLPCPQPVIKVKQAFDAGGFNELEVLVDNKAAVENITRFAENSGHNILSISEENQISTIVIENINDPMDTELEISSLETPLFDSSGITNIFINSLTVGTGELKLGMKLMEAFIFSLTELDHKPDNILIMNSGVKVAVEGSSSMDNLKELEDSGVNILVCGACLDYYGLKEKLVAGKVSNMYEIASILIGKGNTITMG